MNSRWISYLAALILLAGAGCKSRRAEREAAPRADRQVERAIIRDLGGAEPAAAEAAPRRDYRPGWLPELHPYKPSHTRRFDLLHTRLSVRFDWEQTRMPGEAWLTLTPYFYPKETLELDAKGFDVNRVELFRPGAPNQPLKYDYDGRKLRVRLGKKYTREDTFEVYINYVAKPNELEDAEGSAAISGDKGLYFINPDGKIPYKPRQIWTQGQPEASSCWFPTIDASNERTTQEILMTVADTMTTLSNGVMTASRNNGDGTRTDAWRMNLPHPPYLFMMAVGNFAVVQDKWRDREVNYYVEPKYEPYARLVFGNTPEMLDFYSRIFGVDYPWAKYSQIVVRDFVSGAMENTTATVHMEALQHDARAHLDATHEDYISHELTHQWFGDYVTCENWANLTLNEAFATYGEYLWREHKYGKTDADRHLNNDLLLYLMEAVSKKRPVVFHHYHEPGEMFDRHSYQKGGLILHMLRQYVGDDAFFASLKYYLQTHKYTPVEMDELRMAFEDVTGEDLNWFFDQWFLEPGHPKITVETTWEPGKKRLAVRARQTQQTDFVPVFRLPLTVQLDFEGKPSQLRPALFHSLDTTFYFDADEAPVNVVFDASQTLVAQIEHEKPLTAWRKQALDGANFRQRFEAVEALADHAAEPETQAALRQMLKDEFWGIRVEALAALREDYGIDDDATVAALYRTAAQDPDAAARHSALTMLDQIDGYKEDPRYRQTLETALNDSSYRVTAAALQMIYDLDTTRGLAAARKLRSLDSDEVRAQIAAIFYRADAKETGAFLYDAVLRCGDMTSTFLLLNMLARYAADQKEAGNDVTREVELLVLLAETHGALFVRRYAEGALGNFKDHPAARAFFDSKGN